PVGPSGCLDDMKVYSFTAKENEERYPQVAATDWAFRRRGYQVLSFTFDDLTAGRLDEDLVQAAESTVLWGPVGAVLGALDRAQRPRPPRLDYPTELTKYLGRTIRSGTLGEVRASDGDRGPFRWPVHVKPAADHKLFTGVFVTQFRDLIRLAALPGDTPVFVAEPLKLKSEWRATTLRRRVVNLANYKGDPLALPDPAVVAAGAADFVSAPIGYGADWGVTADGQTVLVEVNDGFSLGNYGVPGHIYTALLECRWRELNGLPDNGVGLDIPDA
ncbi:MAG: ATP-grasp domain-containing protein, partial [Planctomycetota bacterium]